MADIINGITFELLKADLNRLLVTHRGAGAQGDFKPSPFPSPTFVSIESETSQ